MDDLKLNESELAVVSDAKTFAAAYLRDHSRQWEMDREMPRKVFKAAADAGLCGLLVSTDLGGKGIGVGALLKVMEELSYVDMAVAFALVVHNNHARFISTAGTADMIERYVPKMIAGETIGAFLLSEPQGGSDAAAITTRAVADGEGFVLNGEKAWITNAPLANLLNVFAQTDPDAGARGIASFQVPADTPGVVRLSAYEMLGGYAIGAGGFRFENVRVGPEQLLVPAGQGFKAALAGIDLARACVAAMCTGMLRAGLDTAMPRLLHRRAFGQPLADQQGLQWQLADVATNLRAASLLAYDCARLIDQEESASEAAAHAKKFATTAAFSGLNTCMQVMGADGLKQEYPLARHLAAAKMAQYLDGTTEIQNVVISRALQRAYADRNSD
jgi:alkylation response protein AidB-like acyl-CoA dehydrogenase